MLITPQQVAIEVERIEGAIRPGLGKTPTGWRWLAGRRYRGPRDN